MYVKLFSVTEVGEAINRFGYECELASIRYLLTIRQENIIGIDESERKPKCKGCYRFGFVDVENKCKFLETNNAQEISNARIVKMYYEVFLTEDAKKLFPDVDRYYIDKDSYFLLTKNV